MFRTEGYDAASTRMLAASLGMRSASLYYHMGRKEDLLFAICVDALVRIQQEVASAIEAEETTVGKLGALVRAHVTVSLADRNKHATMLFELRSLSSSRRRDVVRLRDEYEQMVRRVISRGQREGKIRRDIPAKYLTLFLLDLLNWCIFWYRPRGALTPRELAKFMADVFSDGVVRERTSVSLLGRRAAAAS